jgi:hypothetical protein
VWRARLACAAVALLAVIPFAASVGHPFVFDDHALVTRNELVRSLDPGPMLAHGAVTHGRVEWYRPLTLLSLALNRAATGLDPGGYHLTNLGVHAGNSVLVLAIGRRMLGPAAGLVAAALFAAHAVHAEAVVPVFGRADLLATGFVLLAWRVTLDRRARGGWRAALAGTLGFLGLLAKENAIALPALVLISDVVLHAQPSATRIRRLTAVLWERRWLYASLVAAVAAALLIRQLAVGGLTASGSAIRSLENPLIEADVWARFATSLWVALLYLRLFLLPAPLSADYSYNAIPLIEGLSDPRLLAMIAAVAGLALCVVKWPLRRGRRWPLGAFAVLLLPVSNLLMPIGTIMAERLLYLPSAALCLLAAAAVSPRLAGASGRHVVVAIVGAVLAVHVWLGITRTREWSDEEQLFTAAVRAAPGSAKARVLLATVLLERGASVRAEPLLREAVAIAPAYPEAHNLLGTLHLGRGELDEAARALRLALRDAPAYAPALANLGIVARRQGRQDEAERLLGRAVAADPSLAAAWVNLALLAEMRGDLARAVSWYTRAHALDPSLEVARARAEELSSGGRRQR